MKTNQGAIILGGHVQGLGIIRALGRKGITCVLVDNTKHNLAKHSRYSNGFFLKKDGELLSFLKELISTGKYLNWTVFPTNDLHVKILSKNKPHLEPHFKIAADNWEVVEQFYNKTKSYKLADSIKIPIPKTFYPVNIQSLDNIEIKYPCIIKPAVMHDFYRKVKKKVFICKNPDELKSNYSKALEIIPPEEIIVQEIIPGSSKNQYSACFLFINGQSKMHITACRMRQHPLDFGNATTYAETIDLPVLKEHSEKILNAANYNGLCEVEFKLDERDNEYKFLEVNTRTWKWHSIANKTATPFVVSYFDYLNGQEITPLKEFKQASFFHFITDLPVRFLLFFKGQKHWKRFKRPVEHAVWAWDDLKPWFFEKLYLPILIIKR